MALVKVYHGRGYDIGTDVFLETKRPARRETLLRVKLEVLEDRAYEVEEKSIDDDGFVREELMVALREESEPG